MEHSHESEDQIALFLQGVKDQFNIDSLTEIDQLLDQHFADEEADLE